MLIFVGGIRMTNRTGSAKYYRGKLYFDEVAWALIKSVAKRRKKSPVQIVNESLIRYARKYGKKTKTVRNA
jgi:hypothetical protein